MKNIARDLGRGKKFDNDLSNYGIIRITDTKSFHKREPSDKNSLGGQKNLVDYKAQILKKK